MKTVLLAFCTLIGSSASRPDGVYQDLHGVMTTDELNYYFGVSDPIDVPEYEIVTLSDPARRPDCTFLAFGRLLRLHLEPNDRLIGDDFVWQIRDDSVTFKEKSPRRCHYMHRSILRHHVNRGGGDDGGVKAAAFTYCPGSSKNGIVFLSDVTYELQSINPRLCQYRCDNDNENAFVLKRAPTINHTWTDGFDVIRPGENYDSVSAELLAEDAKFVNAADAVPVLETALYFDEPAYKTFSEYFRHDDERLADMILAYVNAVQVLYHHPSLKQRIEIVLVKLEMFKKQPFDLPHYNGERSSLLDSFCAYNKKHRQKDQWDIGLYISGLDFYSIENGRWSGSTMGLATVGGVCSEKYSCIIAEFGSTDALGKPYPSAGFTSVYILAHEIGHSLGMHHDGSSNDCPKEGFIMSPSRGITGELLWSECSARVAVNLKNLECLFKSTVRHSSDTVDQMLDHNKFADKPGQAWDAKKQCELLLLDGDARAMNAASAATEMNNNVDSSQELLLLLERTEDICENLQCETPNRPGYYFAGPALEGTACGPNLWCEAGKCVKGKPKKPKKIIKGGWSQWKMHECTSGCIHKSKGFKLRTRTCNNPKPVNTNEGCDGPKQEAVLCKDEKVCQKSKKIMASEYATAKCRELGDILPVLDREYSGLQAPHEEARPWMGCSVFCRRKDTGSFYTPRLDVSNLPVDPYFPDGTWCHTANGGNYYCLNHICTSEDDLKRSGKSSADSSADGDLSMMINQNARPPGPYTVPEVLLRYFSVGSDGTPLLTTITPSILDRTDYGDWSSNDDYVDMPDKRSRKRNAAP